MWFHVFVIALFVGSSVGASAQGLSDLIEIVEAEVEALETYGVRMLKNGEGIQPDGPEDAMVGVPHLIDGDHHSLGTRETIVHATLGLASPELIGRVVIYDVTIDRTASTWAGMPPSDIGVELTFNNGHQITITTKLSGGSHSKTQSLRLMVPADGGVDAPDVPLVGELLNVVGGASGLEVQVTHHVVTNDDDALRLDVGLAGSQPLVAIISDENLPTNEDDTIRLQIARADASADEATGSKSKQLAVSWTSAVDRQVRLELDNFNLTALPMPERADIQLAWTATGAGDLESSEAYIVVDSTGPHSLHIEKVDADLETRTSATVADLPPGYQVRLAGSYDENGTTFGFTYNQLRTSRFGSSGDSTAPYSTDVLVVLEENVGSDLGPVWKADQTLTIQGIPDRRVDIGYQSPKATPSDGLPEEDEGEPHPRFQLWLDVQGRPRPDCACEIWADDSSEDDAPFVGRIHWEKHLGDYATQSMEITKVQNGTLLFDGETKSLALDLLATGGVLEFRDQKVINVNHERGFRLSAEIGEAGRVVGAIDWTNISIDARSVDTYPDRPSIPLPIQSLGMEFKEGWTLDHKPTIDFELQVSQLTRGNVSFSHDWRKMDGLLVFDEIAGGGFDLRQSLDQYFSTCKERAAHHKLEVTGEVAGVMATRIDYDLGPGCDEPGYSSSRHEVDARIVVNPQTVFPPAHQVWDLNVNYGVHLMNLGNTGLHFRADANMSIAFDWERPLTSYDSSYRLDGRLDWSIGFPACGIWTQYACWNDNYDLQGKEACNPHRMVREVVFEITSMCATTLCWASHRRRARSPRVRPPRAAVVHRTPSRTDPYSKTPFQQASTLRRKLRNLSVIRMARFVGM